MTDLTLVDTNVLLDVLTDDPVWGAWSSAALARALDGGEAVINQIIYAEVSAGFSRIEDLEGALPPAQFRRDDLPWRAGFIAAKAFLAYRARGGTRMTPLPDFYIGAHAAVAGMSLLTRDRARYATYFPTVRLVAPD